MKGKKPQTAQQLLKKIMEFVERVPVEGDQIYRKKEVLGNIEELKGIFRTTGQHSRYLFFMFGTDEEIRCPDWPTFIDNLL